MIADFDRAYNEVVEAWNVPVQSVQIAGHYADTHVLTCGDNASPPLLCLAGGGDTAAAWYPQAPQFSHRSRVIAPDLPGDIGRTTSRALRSAADLRGWVAEVLDAQKVDATDVIAHSYGAQIAVDFAIRHVERVRSLTLLDPTNVFAPIRPLTALRAIPLLLAPSARRLTAYKRWETRNNWPPTDQFGRLARAGADGPRPHLLVPRRPTSANLERLRHLPGGVTVVIASKSRYHDGSRVADLLATRYPWMRVEMTSASHHQLPFNYRAD